jgi:glycosyl hydrolase family 16
MRSPIAQRRLPHVFALVALCAASGAAAAPANRPEPSRGGSDSASVTIAAPKAGALVHGITRVRVHAPEETAWVGVYACGGWSVGEDHVRDTGGRWSVLWDTRMRGCTNGVQGLDAFAFTSAGDELGKTQIWIRVRNKALQRRPPPKVPPCKAASQPRPIVHQGYRERFGDCFTTLNRRVWCSHQWWEPPPPIGTQFVDGRGVLHLVRRRSDGYPNNTLSSEPCGQAAPKSFTDGYFEARMRWTGVPGSGPAFWLLSTRHATNPATPHINPYCVRHSLPAAECYAGELDVFEGYGNHTDVFTGTVHRNSCDCYGVGDSQNENNWQPQKGLDLAAHWHIYAVKWTRSLLSWYLDGREIMSATPYDSTLQPMHLLFYNWSTDWQPGNEVSRSTPRELQTEVDWVRVWQR